MPYPLDRGTLSPRDYLLAILCAAIRQYSGHTGELRISRDELLSAVELPLRVTKSYDETRRELVLSVGPNFSHAQVFTAESLWQHERTAAAQLIPAATDLTENPAQPPLTPSSPTSPSRSASLPSPGSQSLEGVRTTFSDPQQAEMERRAAQLSDPRLRARTSRADRVRAQAAEALENLQSLQAEEAEAIRLAREADANAREPRP